MNRTREQCITTPDYASTPRQTQTVPPGDRMMLALKARNISATGRIVLATLCNHDGPKGAFPSAATIAYESGITRTTVFGRLKELEACGVLSRKKWHTTNKYIINYKRLSVLSDKTVKKKVDCSVQRDFDCSVQRDTKRNELEGISVVQSDVVVPDNISNGGEYAGSEEKSA